MYKSYSLFSSNNDLPRERLYNFGASVLSDVELLAIIIGSGNRDFNVMEISKQLLAKFENFKGILRADLSELRDVSGIGLARACSIKSCCEIGLRIHMHLDSDKQIVKSPKDIFNLLRKDLFAKEKEHLYLIALNSRMQLISYDLVSVGTINETLIHPREIFTLALKKNAIFIVLVHNHPSNESSPSDADIRVTNILYEAGYLLGIKLLDHVIVCDRSYTSLKELGVMNSGNSTSKGGDYSEKDSLRI